MTLPTLFQSDCLIIFTRYPEPGKTKTRLIPVLGETGAAILHQTLTEKTLTLAKKLQDSSHLTLEVHFNGGTLSQMQQWLGNSMIYQNQVEGDLGTKMAAAFQGVFQRGAARAVIIGTDCPDLDAAILAQAFAALHHHDLVLGPAKDGGYYLIGLRRLIPELFNGIVWGTSQVFSQTMGIAADLNVRVAALPELADIDRPEDLAILDKRG